MEFLTDALTRLGGYFYFILIGAIEVIVAIVLIGILPARKKKEKKQTAASGVVGVLAEGLHSLHIAHFLQIFIVPCFDLLLFVRSSETVEEVEHRKMSADC